MCPSLPSLIIPDKDWTTVFHPECSVTLWLYLDERVIQMPIHLHSISTLWFYIFAVHHVLQKPKVSEYTQTRDEQVDTCRTSEYRGRRWFASLSKYTHTHTHIDICVCVFVCVFMHMYMLPAISWSALSVDSDVCPTDQQIALQSIDGIAPSMD